MDKKQLAKKAELRNGNICRPGGLETFDAADTHANMSGLDHRNVVGTVANSEEKGLQVTLDKLHDKSLLKRRDTTGRTLVYMTLHVTQQEGRKENGN